MVLKEQEEMYWKVWTPQFIYKEQTPPVSEWQLLHQLASQITQYDLVSLLFSSLLLLFLFPISPSRLIFYHSFLPSICFLPARPKEVIEFCFVKKLFKYEKLCCLPMIMDWIQHNIICYYSTEVFLETRFVNHVNTSLFIVC